MVNTVAEGPAVAGISQVKSTIRQLQHESLSFVLLGMYVVGLALVGLIPSYPVLGPALLLYGLLITVWIIHTKHHLASVWLLVIGSLLVIWLIATNAELEPVLYLAALPVGLSVWLVGIYGALALAVACTVGLLLAPTAYLPVGETIRMVTVMGMWGTVGLSWLILQPVLTALEWSWASFEQNRQLLEVTRDRQGQLKQAIADLAEANLQLSRINNLVQGLRQIAEEARRAKEQFVTNVSHELRTPLNMIIGFSEMILQRPEAYGKRIPSALLADLAVIQRNSQHLSSLIDDVLDLSQIEAGRMALTKERVTFQEILESAVIAVRPLFDSKGLYLESPVPSDLPPIFCDRTRIRQVLLNLLSNAGRFTERGGVCIQVKHDQDAIEVSVADTGLGIAPEDQGKLFQPFQQLDGSLPRQYGGSGLGLSISKGFVELHGGKMWLQSEKTVGTTFYFRLPINSPLPMGGNVSQWVNPYSTYQERLHRPVLLVHRGPPRLMVLEAGDSLARLLGRYMDGVEIVPVANLDEATQEMSQGPVQALLINDPSISDALQCVNTTAALPDGTPILICSVPDVYVPAALDISDYLVKPISRAALLGALDRLELLGKTVLIIDDQPEALLLFRRMLASADRGYRVLRAADGREALSILAEEHPDVILLDLVMPGMSGFEFLAKRKDDPDLSQIPIVVLSASDPLGHPIVSNALSVTAKDGLTVSQLVACIESITAVLSAAKPLGVRLPTEKPPDPLVFG
jgi:signal transduction histidine kinase/CheY-like chemotaxis protein